MNRSALLRAAIRKDREKQAKDLHAPKSRADREYQTQLTVFEAIMKAVAEIETRGLIGQERARFVDDKAAAATRAIADIWEPEAKA